MMDKRTSFDTYIRTASRLCLAICERGGILKSEVRTLLRIVRDDRFGTLDAGTVLTLSKVYSGGPKAYIVSK
jgi:hypothetical protein